jgi:hypothetical protein
MVLINLKAMDKMENFTGKIKGSSFTDSEIAYKLL